MERIAVKLIAVGNLHNLAEVHYGYSVADMADNGKVVGNKEVGEVKVFPQSHQQGDNLCLNGNIQSRNWLVTYDEFRPYGQRPGNTDALSLAAAELVRIAHGHTRLEFYHVQ